MGDQQNNRDPSQRRNNKSVRWTGRDDHREHISYENGSNDAEVGDYFTYANASGNRRGSVYDDDDSVSSSSTDSNEDEDNDEVSVNRRAATRANTWFNRLRQEDDSDLNISDSEGASGHESEPADNSYEHTALRNPQAGPSRSRTGQLRESSTTVPRIHVSEHPSVDPYSHIMDIGTKVSGGLAPGGAETRDRDQDPLDDEYRRRRDQLLASLGSHSQPSSPQYEIPDPLNSNSIQLSTLAPSRVQDLDQSFSEEEDRDQSRHSSPSVTSGQSLHSNVEDQKAIAAEAEALREKLKQHQSERTKRTEEILARRWRRAQDNNAQTSKDMSNPSASDGGSPQNDKNPTNQHFSEHNSNSTTEGKRKGSGESGRREAEAEDDSEEEELKRLEEVARQEAELHAKLLVKSHLASNLLKPADGQEGYVDNHRYLLDAGLMDEDIPLDDGEEHNDSHNTGGNNIHSSGKESHNGKKSDQLSAESSSDTLNNEKKGATSKRHEDVSDSESESDEENRNISLRGDPDYVPPPKKVKEGVLGSLLRLYAQEENNKSSETSSTISHTSPSSTPSSTPLASPSYGIGQHSPDASNDGASTHSDNAGSGSKRWKRPSMLRTRSSEDPFGRESRGPAKWLKRPSHHRTPSISHLASSGLAAAGGAASNVAAAAQSAPHNFARRMQKVESEGHKMERRGFDEISAMREKEAKKSARRAEQQRREKEKALKKARLAEQARITVHIADVLQRQRFLLRLGRALMLFGAPSHRLEEYLKITSRVLEIDVQVLYIPGCLLFSFGDATTHTSETKLLKVTQGLNLMKLHSTHLIYKEVVHDLMSLEEASSHIDHLLRSKNIYPWYLVIVFYGLACVCCGMFAYGALWKDMPIIFLVGGGVGFLQFWVQPKSDLYANVFEVSSSIVVSFIGRAFGSIGRNQDVFCFAAIVQASLALILPGYIILVGALELQTKNLVAGSVRMFYANIYSLFLSFGITLGSAIYGWIDRRAVTRTNCVDSIDPKWKILFVPTATLFMATVNQAGPRQLPVMVIIGSAGFAVQYFVQQQVKNAASFTSAIGAFTLGVLGNLYSRVGHGLAFAAMLPGIFVLVPSGVAAQGSLVAGVQVATEIVNSTNRNKTATDSNMTSAAAISELGNTMTQVAVGIVVGLFAATLVVYPLGFKKKRSGLFTF